MRRRGENGIGMVGAAILRFCNPAIPQVPDKAPDQIVVAESPPNPASSAPSAPSAPPHHPHLYLQAGRLTGIPMPNESPIETPEIEMPDEVVDG
ncbi:hypothetical protein CIB48_g8899 [Xylaria polymorpha]|nr:hypothetical protein CIB48_g8899 [Xylaria polymorpha]